MLPFVWCTVIHGKSPRATSTFACRRRYSRAFQIPNEGWTVPFPSTFASPVAQLKLQKMKVLSSYTPCIPQASILSKYQMA